MAKELQYHPRPRDLRGCERPGDREHWKARRQTATLRAATLGSNYRAIERGLNRDSAGSLFARIVGREVEQLERTSIATFGHLLHQLDAQGSRLLHGNPEKYIPALRRLVTMQHAWIRSPRTWTCSEAKCGVQMASLARHVLARYPVPRRFDAVWFNDDEFSRHARGWFVIVAQGGNLRHAKHLPFAMTKAMVHHALAAPESLELPNSLRWGQLRGLGVCEPLALAAVMTRFGTNLGAHAEVHASLIRFLVRFPEVEPQRVAPIVDFALDQQICLDGRTPESVDRLVREWHRALRVEANRAKRITWEPCGISAFAKMIGEGEAAIEWTLVELLSSDALFDEGREMHHCVASYATLAARGKCAIFSLRRRRCVDGMIESRVTVEISLPERKVVQARGACNGLPNLEEAKLIAKWADINQIARGTLGQS
jgi:hypothetical protein